MRYTISEEPNGAEAQQAVGRSSASTGFAKQNSANPAHGERRDAVARLGEQLGTRQQYAQMLAQRLGETFQTNDVSELLAEEAVEEGEDGGEQSNLPGWLRALTVTGLYDLGIDLWSDSRGSMLKDAEEDLVKLHPVAALRVEEAKKFADRGQLLPFFREYRNEEGTFDDGSRPNAFYHILWSMDIADRTWPDMAKAFTDAHETFTEEERWHAEVGLNDGKTLDEHREMDLHNNALGIRLVEEIPDNSLELHNKLLDFFDGDGKALQAATIEYEMSERELLKVYLALQAMENGEHMQIIV